MRRRHCSGHRDPSGPATMGAPVSGRAVAQMCEAELRVHGRFQRMVVVGAAITRYQVDFWAYTRSADVPFLPTGSGTRPHLDPSDGTAHRGHGSPDTTVPPGFGSPSAEGRC